jgi:hypothetical protein
LVAHVDGGSGLRVFENGVLGKILEFKRDKVTGAWRKWRKLYNEKHYDLYCLKNIVRLIK